MRRFKLTLAYIGTQYHGWQRQPKYLTIQQVVEETLAKFLGQSTPIVGASRTDAGVHALGQVAHFDSMTALSSERIKRALAAHLPADISVVAVEEVSSNFHAQKNAVLKHYAYYFYVSPTPYAFWEPYAWRIFVPLDIEAMQQASQALVGRHDFSAFCASDSTAKTFTREVTDIAFKNLTTLPFLGSAYPLPLYVCTVSGKGFLKFMIRNIVGTLVDVGRGQRPPDSIDATLSSCDRKQAGPTAPARGLFLERIIYP